MPGFKGSYTYSVDNKGRINLPAKLRKAISPNANETFTITRGFDKCLFIYPQDEWEKVESVISKLSDTNSRHRYIKRRLLDSVSETQLDSQARITVPKVLLDFASINNEVLILGVLQHIELWNPKEYQAYIEAQQKSYEEVAELVFEKSNP